MINLEKYFQQFANHKQIALGGNCDLLLYSQDKVAFIDLTCMRPEFLEAHLVDGKLKKGKRAIAYSQLLDSINKLSVVPNISDALQGRAEKVAILALRKKIFAFDEIPNKQEPMLSFFRMSNEQTKSGVTQDMGNGFVFLVNEYPNVYSW